MTKSSCHDKGLLVVFTTRTACHGKADSVMTKPSPTRLVMTEYADQRCVMTEKRKKDFVITRFSLTRHCPENKTFRIHLEQQKITSEAVPPPFFVAM